MSHISTRTNTFFSCSCLFLPINSLHYTLTTTQCIQVSSHIFPLFFGGKTICSFATTSFLFTDHGRLQLHFQKCHFWVNDGRANTLQKDFFFLVRGAPKHLGVPQGIRKPNVLFLPDTRFPKPQGFLLLFSLLISLPAFASISWVY